MQKVQGDFIRALIRGFARSGGLVFVYARGAFHRVLQRAGARHTAAGAGHALQQIAVQLAGLGQHQHLFALAQALGGHHLHLALGLEVFDDVHHGLGHPAGHREPAAVCRGLVQALVARNFGKVDGLCFKHAHHFLEGEHKIHIAANGAAAGLQLFGRARANEHHLTAGVFFLQKARGKHHGRQGHGDIGRKIGEELFGHHAPGGAAAGGHEGLVLRHLAQKVFGLFNGAKVGAHGHLGHVVKAQQLHGRAQLFHCHLWAKLPHKGGGHGGNDALALLDGLNHLEDLPLIGNGAKRAVHKAHAARDAFVLVDGGAAVLVRADGVHAAGPGARALDEVDGAVGAHVGALAAFDAFLLVYHASAVPDAHCTLGAHLHAGVRKAALAQVRYAVAFLRAGVAGELDDVDKGRLVILFSHGAGLDAGRKRGMLVDGAQRQADGKAQALAHDGALEKDALAVRFHLAGDDFIRQFFDAAVIAALVCHACHFGEHAPPDIRHIRIDASHENKTPFAASRSGK